MPDTRSEYLVRNGHGVWEICRPGVFLNPDEEGRKDIRFVLAWADRQGAFHCSTDDVVDVRELPE